jgi:L-lactate dehydrogenase complex protein LldE
LRNVRGLEYAAEQDPPACCGFGGTFSIKNADVSSAMLVPKINSILNTRAEICTAVDNSCLMHIYGALHRQRSLVKAMHLAEILASGEGA